jgi:hypothetical protein
VLELMEEELVAVVGARGKHDRERTVVRQGHEAGEVTLGGRPVRVERPRVRSTDRSSEVPLRTVLPTDVVNAADRVAERAVWSGAVVGA